MMKRKLIVTSAAVCAALTLTAGGMAVFASGHHGHGGGHHNGCNPYTGRPAWTCQNQGCDYYGQHHNGDCYGNGIHHGSHHRNQY